MKSIRAAARSALMAGLALALLAAAGCSYTQMMSAPVPLWDGEKAWDENGVYKNNQGDPADRVNVWPIYYCRKPVMSIFWPIFTKADKSHQLVPLYAWDADKKELSLGAITDWIPALARFDRDKTDWRALNVWHDEKNKEWGAFPLGYFDGLLKEFLIFPILYDKWPNGRNEFWTPLLARGDHLQGFLGPLINRYRYGADDSWTYSAPWPFVRWWNGKDEAGFSTPVFSWNREGDKRHQSSLYGLLFKRDAEPEKVDARALFGLAGGYLNNPTDGVTHWATPLWYSERKGDRSFFLSLPYFNRNDGKNSTTVAGLLGYWDFETPDSQYQSLLFPIFHRHEDKRGKVYAALPLGLFALGTKGNWAFMTPLVSYSSGWGQLNVGMFVYNDIKSEDGRYQAWFWPLTFRRIGPDSNTWMIFPFAYRDRHGKDVSWITPLYSSRSGGEKEWKDILGPVYWKSEDHANNVSDKWAPWPLVRSHAESEASYWFALPFVGAEKNATGSAWYSLPFSHGDMDGSQFWNLGGLLAWHSHSNDSVKTRVLLLFGRERRLDREETSTELLPLFHCRKTADESDYWSLTNSHYRNLKTEDALRKEIQDELVRQVRAAKENKFGRPGMSPYNYYPQRRVSENNCLFRLYHNESILQSVGGPDMNRSENLPSMIDSGADNKTTTNSASPAPTIQLQSQSWLFPLFFSQSNGDGESKFNLLWRLYDSRQGVDPKTGETVGMQRVLWRVFHRERVGARVSTDIFPFIAMDSDMDAGGKNKDFGKFSLAGGLIETQHRNGRRWGKFLWIPIGKAQRAGTPD